MQFKGRKNLERVRKMKFMIVARKLLLPNFIIAFGYKTIHFVRSGEWQKPLNHWTSTWRYYCAFSPSTMIGCGHVCWIIEQFRLFFSNSCIMFSLDHEEANWIMMARNHENNKKEFMSTWIGWAIWGRFISDIAWNIVHFYWSMRHDIQLFLLLPILVVSWYWWQKLNHVTSISSHKTAIPLSSNMSSFIIRRV